MRKGGEVHLGVATATRCVANPSLTTSASMRQQLEHPVCVGARRTSHFLEVQYVLRGRM